MSALNSEEMERARRANPLPLDASWSTGDEAFDARIHASLMQRDEARDALEEMRLRAESAEARIASVSGVTREELAKREYERGLAEGKALRDDLLAALKDCVAHMSGGEKSCGHQFECVCVGRNAVAAIAKAEGRP